MIRYVSLWLIMGIALHSFTQTVTISAKGSGEVLESVEIYSLRPPHSTITDANGRADVSAFADADSIYIRRVGFKTILTTYANLQALHFKVQLATSEVLLDEVVISSYQEDPGQQTSLHIEPLHLKTIEQSGSFGISNALATMPGISELSSGIGISKPVIRGLYGNRVLVLLSGLRFDNQQWQDEHGLGLPGFGISRIEVIKGPLSILYGTEAVGGVINTIEEHPPPPETYEADAGVEFHSNTLGGTLQGGVKAAHNKHWFRLRLGAISHCDYSDGNNERVLNSRYNGYLLKTGYGYKHNKWQSENHYYFSYHQFGFIFNGISDFFEPDNRWSRNMSGPHHRVLLNMFTSANTYHLKSSELRLNAGFQSNLRSEDEGGGKLSLIMHLMTAQYSLKWEKPLSENLSLVIANNTSLENNANYGKRKIVPDARLLESNVSVYLKHSYEKLIIEYGAGAGGKYIHTLLTKTVNSGEKEVDPFEQFRTFYNGMLGVSYIPQHRLNIKLNVASGVRAPNLAELSSNGLHEGIYTFEIGDPDLENEKNYNTDLGVYFRSDAIQFSLSGFLNYFHGYIYPDPTDESWYGFPVYRYRQQDAVLYGTEVMLKYQPALFKGLRISASYEALVGKLIGGEYLPYMPARKLKPEVRYEREFDRQVSGYAFMNNEFVFTQNLVNPLEQETPAYQLFNAGAGVTLHHHKTGYQIYVTANNLLNEAYFDHLSRLKTFGLFNIGRDISIHIKIKLFNNLKQNKNEKTN